VVDADATSRALLADQLAGMKFRVDATGTSAESFRMAVEAARERQPYSVVFIDQGIQQPSAISLMRLLRSGPLTSRVRTVLLVQATAIGRFPTPGAAGFDSTLSRRFDHENLLPCLWSLLPGGVEDPVPGKRPGGSSALPSPPITMLE
jgi:CheY-like chemotaxis protein